MTGGGDAFTLRPMAITKLPLSGTHTFPNGAAAVGATVTFQLNKTMRNRVSGESIEPVPVIYTLDASGKIPGTPFISATDDPTTVPTDCYYLVTVDLRIGGGDLRSYTTEVPFASTYLGSPAWDTSMIVAPTTQIFTPPPINSVDTAANTTNIAAHVAASKVGAHLAANVTPDVTGRRAILDTDTTLQKTLERVEKYLSAGVVANMFGKAIARLGPSWVKCQLGTGPFTVMGGPGDSITVGWFGASADLNWFNRTVQRLCSHMNQRVPAGYIPISTATNAGYTGRLGTFANTHVDRNDSGFGLAGSTLTYAAGPNGVWTSDNFQATEVWLYMADGALRGPALFEVVRASDNVVLSTQTCTPILVSGNKGGRAYSSGVIARTNVYARVSAVNAFNTSVEGVRFFDSDGPGAALGLVTHAQSILGTGIRPVINAHFGYRTDHFSNATVSSMYWQDGLDTVSPDLILYALGTNNRQAALSVTQMRADINADIAKTNAVADANGDNRPIYCINAPYVTGATVLDSDAYTQAAWWAALDNFGQVLVYDWSSRVGGYAGTGAGAVNWGLMYTDHVHLSTLGQEWMAENFTEWLLGLLGRPSLNDATADVGSRRTLGAGAQQAAPGTGSTIYTAKATLTAKGSLYAASAASTPAELVVGANGKALMADSAQTTGQRWDFSFICDRASLITGSINQNLPRSVLTSGQALLGTSGASLMTLIGMDGGVSNTGCIFTAGGTALVQGATTNNLWAALCDLTGLILAVTANDTAPVWAANSDHPFTWTAPYVPPVGGQFFLAVNFTWTGAGGVGPTLYGIGPPALTGTWTATPKMSAAGPTGLVGPQAVGTTLAVGAAKSQVAYCRTT